jgi:two-component system CheB/CheR fusion protein
MAKHTGGARSSEVERCARARLERLVDRTKRLERVTSRLARALTATEIAGAIIDEGTSALDASMGGLWLMSDDGASLDLVKSIGMPAAAVEQLGRIPMDSSAALCDAIRRCEPLWLESRTDYSRRYPQSFTRVAKFDVADFATACLPLLVDGRPLGGVCFSFLRAHTMDEDERSFMTVLSHHSALALERVRLFEEQQRTSARLELALAATRLGIWDLSFRSGTLSWDARTRELFELAPDAPMTLDRFYTSVHPDDLDRVRGLVDRATTSGGDGTFEAEYRIIGYARRTVRWIAARGQCFFDEHGSATRFVGTVLDITGKKHVEEALAKSVQRVQNAYTAAKDAERRKDEFLAMLGHELRNPLAPIHTTLQLLRTRGETALERERTIIERQVRHLERLVSDLLDVSRITRGKIALEHKRVELSTIVAEAIELTAPLIQQRRHHLVVTVPHGGAIVEGDRVRLTQVVTNLLNNAAKYSEPNGEIRIALAREGDRVVLRVKDLGVGISPDLVPRIFDLFTQAPQTLARAEGGLGLGLAIVKSLVDMHDGTVRAFSDGPGRGSEFVVTFPAVAADAQESGRDDAAPVHAQPAATHAIRVLVVDDNRDAAETLAEALALEGHDVAVAYDGGMALEVAARCSPDVVLLDIGLPVLDGYEVARRLRGSRAAPAPRLIAVTGYGQESDRTRAAEAGFDDHIVKPVDLEVLLHAVDHR